MRLADGKFRPANSLRFVPIDCSAQTFFKRNLCLEAELFQRPRYVKTTTRLTIRLVMLPSNLTFKASQSRDHFQQSRDPNLASGTNVYRFALVIRCGCAQDSVGAIVNVEKLT